MGLSAQRWPRQLRPNPPTQPPGNTPSYVHLIWNNGKSHFPELQRRIFTTLQLVCNGPSPIYPPLGNIIVFESSSLTPTTPHPIPPSKPRWPAPPLPTEPTAPCVQRLLDGAFWSKHRQRVKAKGLSGSSQGWWPPFCQRWPHVKRVSAGVLSWVMCAKDLPPPLFEGRAFTGCEVQPFLFVGALFRWMPCGLVCNLQPFPRGGKSTLVSLPRHRVPSYVHKDRLGPVVVSACQREGRAIDQYYCLSTSSRNILQSLDLDVPS